MVCNILIISVTIFTAIMGFNYINVTSLSYIHLPKKIFLIFAGSIVESRGRMLRCHTVLSGVVIYVGFA